MKRSMSNDSGNNRIKDFKDEVEQLLIEVRLCSNAVEVEIGKLTGMKGELSGIVKELEQRKTMLEKKPPGQELSDEELGEIGDAVDILKEELVVKRRETEEILKDEGDGAKKAEQYLTDLKYLQAEFENYKRRTEKDKRDFADYLLECFITDLLPIKDNLEAATGLAKENENTEGLVKGVEMTLKQLKELLESKGLEEIKAEGEKFDPFRHEVVSKAVNENQPENTVIEVIRNGYVFREKVIRPAMVKIAVKNS